MTGETSALKYATPKNRPTTTLSFDTDDELENIDVQIVDAEKNFAGFF